MVGDPGFGLFLFVLAASHYSQPYIHQPEFLSPLRSRARLLFTLLTLFINVIVDSAGVLYSGALVCQLLFPGWPFG